MTASRNGQRARRGRLHRRQRHTLSTHWQAEVRQRDGNPLPVLSLRFKQAAGLEGDRVIHHEATALSRFSASELKAGERVAGRYRIEGLLGVGGMGVVYRAHDEQLDIDIALKLLRPELASRPEAFERFRQELLLARQVSSPHVVRIHDLVADGERWLISMDYVPGRSLEQLLDGSGPLAQDQALSIARQIALGLAAAHASGIVHRDLKPANILVRDDGHACISDFGVARSVGAARATGTGMTVGTPDYLSPEQARGENVDHRSDLYALGLILHEMLSGQRPFADLTAAESLAQRQFRRPTPLADLQEGVAPWVGRLTTRLLDPNPLRRLRDAEAVVAAIDAKRVSRALPGPLAVVAMTVLLLSLAYAGWWIQQRGSTPRTAASVPANSNAEAAVPAAVPLDVIVLPLQADPADVELARAYSALITTSLLAGEIASADRRQVQNALVRLGFDEAGAARHPQRVVTELGARRALSGRLVRDGERVSMVFALTIPGNPAAAKQVRTPSVSVEAQASAVRSALAQMNLHPANAELGTFWPASEQALRAFGKGLAAGDGSTALGAFADALKTEPRFVAAWWQRLLIGRRLLPDAAMTAMSSEAREALRGMRGRDAERVLALIALIEGNPKLAVERFAPIAAADPHDHHTRLLHAEALEASGDRKGAIAQLDRLTAQNPQSADAWLLRGQVAIRAGEAQRAVDDHLLRARVLYTRQRDDSGRADALNALGLGFDLLGQTEPAIYHLAQAAELRETLGNSRAAASSRRNLAWAHAVAGDIVAAEADLKRARALAVPLQDTALLADIANDAGLIAEERGDFRAALPYFREALRLREARGDTLGVAEAASNLGFALQHTGRFSDAHTYLDNAERAYAAAQDRTGIARSVQMLGSVDMALGDLVSAETRLRRALKLAEEVNLADERAINHAELAELARLQGNREAALREAELSLALFQQQGDARGTTEARLRMAAVHADASDWDAVEKALATIPAEALDNREQAAALAIHRGEIAMGRGDRPMALKHADAALADADAAHSYPMQLRARLLRMGIHLAGGNKAAANRELPEIDRLLQNYPAAELRRTRARLVESMRGTLSPAQRKVATTQGRGRG